jgi:hypothetical protein
MAGCGNLWGSADGGDLAASRSVIRAVADSAALALRPAPRPTKAEWEPCIS